MAAGSPEALRPDTAALQAGAGAATINYGLFINNIIDFLIIAFAIFLLVRQINRYMPKPAAPPPIEAKDCPYCRFSIPKEATRCPHCTSELK